MESLIQELKELITCPITGELMVVPAVLEDGHTYEHGAINDWLTRSRTSPFTRKPVAHAQPSRALRKVAELVNRLDPTAYDPTDIQLALLSLGDKSFIQFRISPDDYDRIFDEIALADASGLIEYLASFELTSGEHLAIKRFANVMELLCEYYRLGHPPTVRGSALPLMDGELPNPKYLTYDYFRVAKIAPGVVQRLGPRERANLECARYDGSVPGSELRAADISARLQLAARQGRPIRGLFTPEEIAADKDFLDAVGFTAAINVATITPELVAEMYAETVDGVPLPFAFLNQRRQPFPLSTEIVGMMYMPLGGVPETLAHRALALGLRGFAGQIAKHPDFPINAGVPHVVSLLGWCPVVHAVKSNLLGLNDARVALASRTLERSHIERLLLRFPDLKPPTDDEEPTARFLRSTKELPARIPSLPRIRTRAARAAATEPWHLHLLDLSLRRELKSDARILALCARWLDEPALCARFPNTTSRIRDLV